MKVGDIIKMRSGIAVAGREIRGGSSLAERKSRGNSDHAVTKR
jgi:hypothetical protein